MRTERQSRAKGRSKGRKQVLRGDRSRVETAMVPHKTAVLASVLICLAACNQPDAKPDAKPSADGLTRGEYMGQKWHIDKNHLLHWDGKPFIPSFINDFSRAHYLSDDFTIEQVKEDIDAAIGRGQKQFWLDIDYIDSEWFNAKQADGRVRQVTEHINASGGTYYLAYSIQVSRYKLLAQQDPDRYAECVREFLETDDPCTDNFVVDMLKPERVEAFRQDLRRIGSIAATPALRAIELIGEINANEHVVATDDKEMIDNLAAVFNTYGKTAKEEIGDVPVVFRGGGEGYLAGLRAEHWDGVTMQYSGSMPEHVHTLAQRHSTILRLINSCPKTKVYWSYAQGRVGFSFFLYRSKELMRGHYMGLVEAGVTGLPFDQFSSNWFSALGMEEPPPGLREDNRKWWVELQPELEAEILRRAENDEFSTGSWAVPITDEQLLQFLSSNTLDKEQVDDIIRADPDVGSLIDLGADVGEIVFLSDYSAWLVVLFGNARESGMSWDLYVDDSPDGTIVLSGIKLVRDMRQAGYPIPPDQVLIDQEPPCDECVTGDGKTGCACFFEPMCIDGQLVDECCVGGFCF